MTDQIQIFDHEEFGELDVLMIDDKPFFPATDCAKMLGYSNPHDAIKKHCRYLAKREVPHPQNPAKTILVNFIPEGDLYRLIIRSKLPAAERFEKWVFDEVLPSIRAHGAYITRETLDGMLKSEKFAEAVLDELFKEYGKNTALMDKVEEMAPKARYCDTVLQTKRAVPVSVIAKDYGMSAVAFNKLLHSMGIQYKTGGTWLLYQKYANKGYTKTCTYYVGDMACSVSTLWTQKGRMFIYDFLAYYGILPIPERFGGRTI